MRNVPLMSLADIAESVRYGYTASASDSEVGPKFLRITDIVPPQIDWVNVPYCEIDEKNLTKFSLEPDDIVIARTGATVGYAKLIRDNEPSVFASYLVRIRVDPEKADPGYVGRIVESEVYKRFVLSRVGGAAQPNANAKVLSSFRLPIPEKATQRRIASILSAYDDLIENNRRRIGLLEQAARLLYKEWFVHLRFPGHEHATITDGVPEGWEAVRLQDITSVVTKGTTPTSLGKAFTDEGINFIKVESVEENGGLLDSKFAHIDESTHNLLRRSQLYEGDILFSIAGAIGRSALVPACMLPANTNQALAIIRVRDPELRVFLFLTVRSAQFQNYSLGRVVQTAQKNVSLTALKEARVIMPNKTIMVAFLQQAGELQSMLWTLREQNNKLVKARDLLLPRLMNGEVAV